MKNILLILLITLNLYDNKNIYNASNNDKKNEQTIENILNKNIDKKHKSESDFIKKSDYLDVILNYYDSVYEEELIYFKKNNYSWTKMKKSFHIERDSILKVSYNVLENSSYTVSIMTIYLPLKIDVKCCNMTPIIYGDINGDDKEDFIITVYSDGGWNGSNSYWNMLFVFLNRGDHYEYKGVTADHDIGKCGSFVAREINNNLILGESLCYSVHDGRCCPSIKYKTTVIFENNKFKTLSQKLVEE